MDHTDTLINLAIEEDVGRGDITSKAIVPAGQRSTARIIAKQGLVLSGMDVAGRAFKKIDKRVSWKPLQKDGSPCKSGDEIAVVRGKTRALLAGERTALNFLQHLSGIATETRRYVEALSGSGIKILDTRKTTPGFRVLEKHAVKMGGGTNHRIGLFDHFLIKNNHISAAGSISAAVALAKKKRTRGQWIEVEARTLDDVHEALSAGADIIMFDNMSIDMIRKAVKIIGGRAKTEISGNVTLKILPRYKDTGVDFISAGAITHSAPAADIHMLIEIAAK